MQEGSFHKPARRKRTLSEQRESGMFPYHARACSAKGWDEPGVCVGLPVCEPTFQPAVYDKRSKKPIRGPKGTQAEARSWLIDAKHAKKKGTLQTSTSGTFKDARVALIAGMKSGTITTRSGKRYKPKVIRDYEAALVGRLGPEFDAHKLIDLRRNDWQDYVDERIAEGLSGRRIKNILMPAKVIYRRAIQRDEVSLNPTSYLDIPVSEVKRERVADPKEAAKLIEALPEEDRALWATALYAGPRMSELRALKVANDHGTYLEVERSWDDVEGEIDTKSSAGVRKIPVCDHLRIHLELHLARLGRDSGLLFGETATTPFNYGKTTRRAYAAWKDAGLERIGLHSCRHSFRSYLDAIPAISETRADRYAGHVNTSMRARYSHSLAGQLATDAAALDEYLEAATAGKVVPLRAAS